MSVTTCLNVQVYVQVCMCASHVVGSLHSEVILAWICAVLRSVQNRGLQISLSCRDMKTISLTADLTTMPQDKCQTCISRPASKLDDCVRAMLLKIFNNNNTIVIICRPRLLSIQAQLGQIL